MKKNPTVNIIHELDSDDELPETYNDATILPAYRDDSRFDEITFPWVNNFNLNKEHPVVYESEPHAIVRRQGVLNGQDLFCLKSVESLSCSTTFLWFINFLLYKDLQSHYDYLRSCLVSDFISKPFTKNNCSLIDDISQERYEIVIKI